MYVNLNLIYLSLNEFFQSITEPNFQYMAAKLCNLLSMEQKIVLKNGEKFRSVFMNR